MLQTETFHPVKLQAMFDAFAELPYKVLWKANREKFPKGLVIPSNIHFEKWTPQLDILCKLCSLDKKMLCSFSVCTGCHSIFPY